MPGCYGAGRPTAVRWNRIVSIVRLHDRKSVIQDFFFRHLGEPSPKPMPAAKDVRKEAAARPAQAAAAAIRRASAIHSSPIARWLTPRSRMSSA